MLRYILKLVVEIGKVLLYINLFFIRSYDITTLFHNRVFKLVLTSPSFTLGFPSCNL